MFPSAKRARLEMDDDWDDDDDAFSQAVIEKCDELCSQSSLNAPAAIHRSADEDDAFFRRPALPINGAAASAVFNGAGDNERRLERELRSCRERLEREESEKTLAMGQVSNLRIAQENHNKDLSSLRASMEKRHDEALAAERGRAEETRKALEQMQKERDRLQTQLAFKTREANESLEQRADLKRLLDEREKAASCGSCVSPNPKAAPRGPSPKRPRASAPREDPSLRPKDEHGFPLSQAAFGAMPAAGPMPRRPPMKEAAVQTAGAAGSRRLGRRAKANLSRRSTSFDGSRCADHVLATLEAGVRSSVDGSGSTRDSGDFLVGFVEGIREMIRAANLSRCHESEASLYVGLSLLARSSEPVANLARELQLRTSAATPPRPLPPGRAAPMTPPDRALIPRAPIDLPLLRRAATGLRCVGVLLRHCPVIVRDQLLTEAEEKGEEEQRGKRKGESPSSLLLSSLSSILSSSSFPPSLLPSFLLDIFLFLSSLSLACFDSRAVAALLSPFLTPTAAPSPLPTAPSPLQTALQAALGLSCAALGVASRRRLAETIVECLNFVAVVVGGGVYHRFCGESEDCFFLFCFRAPSLLRSTGREDNSSPRKNADSEALDRLFIADALFSIGFALMTPFPRKLPSSGRTTDCAKGSKRIGSGSSTLTAHTDESRIIDAPMPPRLAERKCACLRLYAESVVACVADSVSLVDAFEDPRRHREKEEDDERSIRALRIALKGLRLLKMLEVQSSLPVDSRRLQAFVAQFGPILQARRSLLSLSSLEFLRDSDKKRTRDDYDDEKVVLVE